MNRHDDNDRFGMSESAFRSAMDAHQGINRLGMFIPTRAEVRSMEAEALAVVLDVWMYESPSELIPSDEQIDEVVYELGRRSDHSSREVASIVEACRTYLKS